MHKPLLLWAGLGLLAPAAVHAQVVTVSVGTSSSVLSPINHNAPYQAQEFIYLQSQLNQAGSITRLAFEKASGSDTNPITNTVIYLKTVAATAFTTGVLDTTGYQRVWAGSFPNAGTSGYQEVTLRTPFRYNNTDNLALLVIRNNGNVASSSARALWRYDFINTRNSCRRYSGANPLSAATSLAQTDVLVNLRLTFGNPTASAKEHYLSASQLYPNPAKTELYLAAEQPARLWVSDLAGRTVRAAQLLRPVGGRISLPVAELPAGVYLLHQQAPDGTAITQRFVRE
ncbi:T9SS type A sorting domain-containing protein [Hymenobacter gummosus]|uniref:T9SS type A sorting domain-containing protein n=1 Tax=Hymenobacter gummosus TaxID=1776032 RepID=A0A3S0JCG8_9BACT|nr:T9SS type A sorting domain-containing protein [Hymenobacter gummosus]RTQ52217.1 T9SS type A sorting domain-containing protein [Hymenobacter gummosus]